MDPFETVVILTVAIALLMAAVLATLLIFIRRKAGKNRQALETLARRLHGRITEKSLSRGDLAEGRYRGVPFSLRFFMGARNAPPSLTIRIGNPSAADLKIRRQAWYDRFALGIGLVRRPETGDPRFDETYYPETDLPELIGPLLASREGRQAIEGLFGSGAVREVICDKGGVAVVLAPIQSEEVARAPAERCLEGLLGLGALLPAGGDASASGARPFAVPFRSPVSRTSLVLLWVAKGLLIAGGLVALGYGMYHYEPLGSGLILRALALSAPMALLVLWVEFRWIRGRSASHRQFLVLLVLSLFCFPLALTGSALVTNGLWDDGKALSRLVPVTDRYERRNKNSRTYYLAFPSWQQPGETDRLAVPKALFESVRQGERIAITTRPGYWQQEWIAGIGRAPQAQPAPAVPGEEGSGIPGRGRR